MISAVFMKGFRAVIVEESALHSQTASSRPSAAVPLEGLSSSCLILLHRQLLGARAANAQAEQKNNICSACQQNASLMPDLSVQLDGGLL